MEQLRSPEADVRAVSRRRILVCDDEREIADMVARLLEREGFFCLACYDPSRRLTRFAETRPILPFWTS